ncbi:MAG: ABC transporter ATP-binding protein [Lachnospiraceae bacterium]|jgi:ABC-2 type transport system ATP-binding protein|nr:ABC transporter ATP-binding protein [Lachnospiraceae bacterium]
MMAQAIVQVEHLHLTYKHLHAVQDVSFSVKPGEILAVIGQNGSGKTSTVECVEGLRKPDRGSIRVLGKDPWQRRSQVYKEMGVQLQEAQYPSKIRVEEQCKLFASFYERPADWNLLLTQMGLDEKRKRPMHKLSGGEKQRLSIILSLMGRPKLLILDELTTGLDPEVRQNMWMSFENIRKSGVAIIMVSHYLDEVETLADKILYLEKGRQQFFGTQREFRAYVKSRVSPEEWEENSSLEKLYLMIAPKTTGLTMEGIL